VKPKPYDHHSVGTKGRAELVEDVRDLGFTKEEAIGLVDEAFSIAIEALGRGENLKFSRFGRFEVQRQHERTGRNPQTGASLTLPARNTVAFRTAPALRAALTTALSPTETS